MAYRAGAKLINMEFPNRHAGPKYFARAGKSSWIGVFTDPAGRPVGPFIDKPTRELGDITADVWNSVFSDMHKSGRGPVYMDCTRTSPEDLEYMWWGLKHEGQTAMLDFMVKEGIDLRRHKVEFTRYEPFLTGRGIEIDQKPETCVKGLYAAGDEVGNLRGALSGAAVFGWIAGQSAAERARAVPSFEKTEDHPLVAARLKFFSMLLERKEGATWQEGNLALQQIMDDYAGEARSETLLKAGLKYLRDLKQKAIATLKADDSHTLMRSLEVIDLMECGEVVFLAALERRETRASHVRTDFPFTNPLWQDRFITIKQENGKPKIEWRDRR
jgi:succinate dehydrogenase/fumarate reductase flavoprotein subunit